MASAESGILPWSQIINEEGLGKLKKTLVPEGWQGANVMWLALNPPASCHGETIIFLSFLLSGLLPPFSHFFLAILDDFQIQLLHLTPNSIMMLAIFTHLYEMFVGVLPSVALFHHFFAL